MSKQAKRRPGAAPPGPGNSGNQQERYQASDHASKLASTEPARLVTVESQRELDLFSGERVERTFVKLYVEARRSGLLSAISDRDWKTLCTLATYMDADGYCYPSQAELAKAMGCSRQMANERVRSLASFRFEGQSVLLVVKGERSEQGTWSRNGYRVLPISSLRIYDHDQPVIGQPQPRPTVSRKLDTVPVREATVSSGTGTVGLDTKKNHTLEQEENISNIRRVSPDVDKSGTTDVGRERGGDHRDGGVERVDRVLARRRSRPRRVVQQDEDYQVLQAYIADFAREFNDRAPLKASTTRAYNLFMRAGVSRAVMIDQLYAARAIVKERTGSIRSRAGVDAYGVPTKNKAAYYFAVLEDLLGLRDDGADPIAPE